MAEIERKWLVAALPDGFDAWRGASIRQGYVALTDDVEVRVREIDDRHLLTIKSAGELTRAEVELPISKADFERLWPLTEGRRIEKTRTVIGLDGLSAEVDVYAGSLAPLRIVEVEFGSERAAAACVPPAWFGREVTRDARYKNRSLALAGHPPADV
jgi:CYTH domain-containing protein